MFYRILVSLILISTSFPSTTEVSLDQISPRETEFSISELKLGMSTHSILQIDPDLTLRKGLTLVNSYTGEVNKIYGDEQKGLSVATTNDSVRSIQGNILSCSAYPKRSLRIGDLLSQVERLLPNVSTLKMTRETGVVRIVNASSVLQIFNDNYRLTGFLLESRGN